MNAPFDPSFLVSERFAVGQPVSRKEDPVLLRGQGRYTDDLNRPGQLYGVMVRSSVAHGVLRSLETESARALPGVHAAITVAELDATGIRNMPAAAGKHRDGSAAPRPPRLAYDEDGQLLTGSFMDYGLPRASDLPRLGFESHPVPARTNPLGAKGCGEAGCAGSLPAVMNALVDALAEFGITHIDMPATPQRIWQAIQAARGG